MFVRMSLIRVAAMLVAGITVGCLAACTQQAPVTDPPASISSFTPESPTPTVGATSPQLPEAPDTGVTQTEGGKGFTDHSGFEDEYQATVDQLSGSLPSGFVFPAEPAGSWDPQGSYEAGTGEIQAGFYWQCAWTYTYTHALSAGDASTANDALDELDSWADLPAVKPHVDPQSMQSYVDAVADARKGDDSQLLAMSSSGCTPSENSKSSN